MRITYGEATQEHELPFIRKGKRGRIESYWDAKPTGDFCHDSATGTEYALNFMAASYQRELGTDLLPILRDMAKGGFLKPVPGGWDGVVHAFLCTIANVSVDGWTPANIARERAREAESNAFIERHRAEESAERSKRARKAALAGAAKRRKKVRKRV